MKACRTHKFSNPPLLSVDEIEPPAPGEGQVLIEVKAVSLHLADVATLVGERSPRPALPFAPGMEAAGQVVAVGAGVKAFDKGDRVLAFRNWGMLAEQVAVDTKACVKIADPVNDGIAAALPFAYAGAHIALHGKAKLTAGETLLVLGAGSQVGLAAVEAGKVLGANVIASAAGAARGEAAAALGANNVVDPSLVSLSEAVLKMTGGKGADVVFDPVGGEATNAAVSAGASGARILLAGFSGGQAPNLNLLPLFARDMRLISANMAATIAERPDDVRRAAAVVLDWLEKEMLHPRIAAQFPLAQAAHALDYVRSRRGAGAVIVTMGG